MILDDSPWSISETDLGKGRTAIVPYYNGEMLKSVKSLVTHNSGDALDTMTITVYIGPHPKTGKAE